jgi:hypothetical protein
MIGRLPLAAAVLLALLAACAAPPPLADQAQQDPLAAFSKGMWIEAKGTLEAGVPLVREIDELKRDAADKADKSELTAPVDSADATSLRMLGVELTLDDDCEYEDAEKNAITKFTPATGEWLRVKVRLKDGRLRARTLRRTETRTEFKVVGELAMLDAQTRRLEVGNVPLRLAAQAQADRLVSDERDDPLALFFADELKSVPFTFQVTDSLRAGGQLSADVEFEDEADLDRADSGDRRTVDGQVQLNLLWALSDSGSFALLEGRASQRERWRAGGADTSDDAQSISRAYTYLRFSDSLNLQLGRHDFTEQREWLYDRVFDGARLQARAGDWRAELAGAFGREFAEEEGHILEETNVLEANVSYLVSKRHTVTVYALDLDDGSVRDREPTLFGLRSFERPYQGFGHWLEIAYARGKTDGKEVDGFAFDIGGMWRFDGNLRSSVYAGIAYASGRDPNDPRSGFRQTGLHDNNGKFGGVTGFRYYGELFDPELANLEVTTLGAGIRPGSFSADLVFHTYRQDYLSATQVTGLRTQPNGNSERLGWEIDLVLGYRWMNQLSSEFVAAQFQPWDGFDGNDPSHKVTFQVRAKF